MRAVQGRSPLNLTPYRRFTRNLATWNKARNWIQRSPVCLAVYSARLRYSYPETPAMAVECIEAIRDWRPPLESKIARGAAAKCAAPLCYQKNLTRAVIEDYQKRRK